MRLNKYIAQYTSHSRRSADDLILNGRVKVNDIVALTGQKVDETDQVRIDGALIKSVGQHSIITIVLNKPQGYVCSRNGQGSKTVFELLPENLVHLNYVGRLDKESTGLLVMTNDGQLANELTHPSHQKIKIYQISLDKPLRPLHQQMIADHGILLDDGPSRFEITKLDENSDVLQVSLREGRNRQIRRTFEALGYKVLNLHRTHFGNYQLDDLAPGEFRRLRNPGPARSR